MPRHDGWTAIRERTSASATAQIPIIAVSGLDDAARHLSTTMLLVRKPLDGNLLLREIRRVLGEREHARILVAEDDDDLRGSSRRRCAGAGTTCTRRATAARRSRSTSGRQSAWSCWICECRRWTGLR